MNKAFIRLSLFSFLILNPFFQVQSQINFLEIPFEELVEKAKQENKPIFLFLSNNNNESWWMENNVFNNQAISDFYNENFICGIYYGQINYSDLSTEKLKIKKYPFILYFDPINEAGYSASGGKTEEQIFNYGKTVANEFKILSVINHRINNFYEDK